MVNTFFLLLCKLIGRKLLTFPRNFLHMRGDRKSPGSIESGFILTTGPCAGFCIFKNDLILITSVSYELSANDRPFDARRQAAIHFAYWSSCEQIYISHMYILNSFSFYFTMKLNTLTLSQRIHISWFAPYPSSGGTSNLILNFPWAKVTSGVTSQPRKFITMVGVWLLRKWSFVLYKYRYKSLYANQ